MATFPKTILDFLKNVQADRYRHVGIVPKSRSAGSPGDILFFKYPVPGSTSKYRIFLIVEPIVKDARTGNLLLTGFKVPDQGDYSPESLENLYKNRELPKDNYRTYIMSKIMGPLRRIHKLREEKR